MNSVSQHLLNGREKGKVAERQRERGCVCASVGRHRDSVGQHPQTTRRKRTHGNTYCEHLGRKNVAASLINEHETLRSWSDIGSHDQPDNGLGYLVKRQFKIGYFTIIFSRGQLRFGLLSA